MARIGRPWSVKSEGESEVVLIYFPGVESSIVVLPVG